MEISLNKVLLSIPLYQLDFLTPFPKETIIYRELITSLDDLKTGKKTLLIVDQNEEWSKINKLDIAQRLTAQAELVGMVIYNKTRTAMNEIVRSFYEKQQFPIIQIDSKESLNYFFEPIVNNKYEKIGLEIEGFQQRGFINIAINLARGLAIPLVFLDENKKVLWNTGREELVDDCLRWIEEEDDNKFQDSSKIGKVNANEILYPYIRFPLNIGSETQLFLISSAEISRWQKKLLDKFNGLTSVVLQTDEFIRQKNEQFKEFFIYELIYRKFESKKSLISQGKSLGWNLDRSHHLLIVDIQEELEELAFYLETAKEGFKYPIIIFPFQEQLVILAEDDQARSEQERKNIALSIGKWLIKQIQEFQPDLELDIGIGKWYDDTIDLNKSYQEAKIAILFGKLWFEEKKIHHINDLGVIYLLTNIHRDLLGDFCHQCLSELIDSDLSKGTEYLKTLKLFFQHNCVIKDTSEAIYLHPNSLRKRLQNIENICGVDLQNMDDLVSMMIAVKIYYIYFNQIQN